MSRICTSCSNERRDEIDARLRDFLEQAGGDPGRIPYSALKATADAFGINPTSMKRHFLGHVCAGRTSQRDQRVADLQLHAQTVAAAREARQSAAGAAVAVDADKAAVMLLAELTGLTKALEDSIARCEVDGDERGVRDTATALRGAILARARLLGLLEKRREPCPDPPPVVESAEFATVLAAVMAPLAKHPGARRDVLVALETVRAAG